MYFNPSCRASDAWRLVGYHGVIKVWMWSAEGYERDGKLPIYSTCGEVFKWQAPAKCDDDLLSCIIACDIAQGIAWFVSALWSCIGFYSVVSYSWHTSDTSVFPSGFEQSGMYAPKAYFVYRTKLSSIDSVVLQSWHLTHCLPSTIESTRSWRTSSIDARMSEAPVPRMLSPDLYSKSISPKIEHSV